MQTHIGVDLHQRFCYLTAVDASGRTLKQGQVANNRAALRLAVSVAWAARRVRQAGPQWLAGLELSPAARVVADVWLKVVDQLSAGIAEQDCAITA